MPFENNAQADEIVAAGAAWFERYAATMREQVPADAQAVLDEFDMKVHHTLRVRARSEEIAQWLGLSGAAYRVASLCGLYHDLGRFVQAVRFGTMDDRVTGSHADFSAEIFLREAPKEGLSPSEIAFIEKAVRYHNLYRLPEDLDDQTRQFARITRDADKLDIFRHIIDQRTGRETRVFRFVQYTPEGCFDPALLAAVLRGENFLAAKVHNRKDRLLLELSLIYDLNFGVSFQQALAMGYVEQLTACFVEGELAEVAAYALDYMRKRTEWGAPQD